MDCQHSPHFYPLEKYTEPPAPAWKFWRIRAAQIVYEWHCVKCGIEMEPVFKVKEAE